MPYSVTEVLRHWLLVYCGIHWSPIFFSPPLFIFPASSFHNNQSCHYSLAKEKSPASHEADWNAGSGHTLLSALMHVLFIGIKAWDHVELIITGWGQSMNVHVQSQDLSPRQWEHKAHPQAIIHSMLLNQLIRTYFWMILSTSKLQVTSRKLTSRKLRARFPSTELREITRKPTPDQVSLLGWFLAQKWASEQVVFLSYIVRLMLKKAFAADSTLSSSFLEPLLKMNLQLQDYTCTGDACGSQ